MDNVKGQLQSLQFWLQVTNSFVLQGQVYGPYGPLHWRLSRDALVYEHLVHLLHAPSDGLVAEGFEHGLSQLFTGQGFEIQGNGVTVPLGPYHVQVLVGPEGKTHNWDAVVQRLLQAQEAAVRHKDTEVPVSQQVVLRQPLSDQNVVWHVGYLISVPLPDDGRGQAPEGVQEYLPLLRVQL